MPQKTQKPPKNHHFLPQCQLAYFQKETGSVWQFDAKTGLFSTAGTRNMGAETKLYTVTLPDGTKDTSVETYFSEIEGDVSEVLKKIDAQDFALSNHERSILSSFASLQMWRTPQSRERIKQSVEKLTKRMMSMTAYHDKAFENSVKRAGEKHPDLANLTPKELQEMRETFMKEDYDLVVPHEYFITFMLEGLYDIAKHIHEISWSFLVAPPGSQFLISDDPFFMYYPRTKETPFYVGPGIKVAGTQITFPLTPRVCLLMLPGPYMSTVQHISKSAVREINIRTAGSARRFLYGANETLLRSIVSKSHLSQRGVREPKVSVSGGRD